MGSIFSSSEEKEVWSSEEEEVSRSVEIQISNNTKNITLRNPKIYFFNGHSLWNPEPSVPPGSFSTSKFTNNSWHWGCNGVLAFEAKPFTLAIYFSNPTNHNQFSPEMGLELSRDKFHKGHLEKAYHRLVRISHGSSSKEDLMLPSVILTESHETALLNAGPVKVTATMSQGPDTVIRVKVEEQESSTAAFDYNWFSPEMDLEQFPDEVQEGGPDTRGDNSTSIVPRELQEMAQTSTSLGRVRATIVQVWEAVTKWKAKKTKSPGRELEARALQFQEK